MRAVLLAVLLAGCGLAPVRVASNVSRTEHPQSPPESYLNCAHEYDTDGRHVAAYCDPDR